MCLLLKSLVHISCQAFEFYIHVCQNYMLAIDQYCSLFHVTEPGVSFR
jgi:hypothetical protein